MSCVVDVKSVTKGFEGQDVLKGISLCFSEGRLHGLVGPGGVGKSLLLRIIATLLPPDRGTVVVFGKDVYALAPDELITIRRKIGFQFQNLALFDFLSVKENVAFPITQGRPEALTPEVEERVRAVLNAVGLHGTEELGIHELSGGMQRRVAMARALLFEPSILILDDPSAGLDPVTSSRIFELIRRHFERTGCTVIVATQDVDRLTKIADYVHILYNGEVRFTGTLEEAWSCKDEVVQQFFPNPEKAGGSAPSLH